MLYKKRCCLFSCTIYFSSGLKKRKYSFTLTPRVIEHLRYAFLISSFDNDKKVCESTDGRFIVVIGY